MELKTAAAFLTLGCLVLCGMTSVVLAYSGVESDIADFDDFDTAHEFIKAAKDTQQQQSYTPEMFQSNEPNVADSKASDDFKIDDDTYRMLKERKAEGDNFHVEEEFLKRKHTAADQQRYKRQEVPESGPNCTITSQTFTNQSFNNRSFVNCTFTSCTFTNCRLINCTFSNRSLDSCTFTNCTFGNSTFSNNTLTNCTFTNCIFTNRSFFNCAFSSCTFTTCTFPDCNFTQCTFSSTTFTPPLNHNC